MSKVDTGQGSDAFHLCEELDRPVLLLVQLQHSAQKIEK